MDTADTDTRLARQYGGYGNYGGFVECCEGVVDPLFLLTIIVGEDLDTIDTTDTMTHWAALLLSPAHLLITVTRQSAVHSHATLQLCTGL